jgi:hypothetical protein
MPVKPAHGSKELAFLIKSEVNDLEEELRSYASGRRDSKRESALLQRVRALPQSQRLAVLAPLLELNAGTALVFIDRVQLTRSNYLAIFERGLVKGNASSVKFWMKATVTHLGWNKFFSVLRESMFTNPRGGAFALYHVPGLCRGNAPQPSLSGPLPTRKLAVEYLRLIVLYHDNGHRVVDDRTLNRVKKALSDLQ